MEPAPENVPSVDTPATDTLFEVQTWGWGSSSATILRDTFHFFKRFAVVREEGPAEGLFDKEPGPPPPEIHNLTVPPSSPGYPIEAGVLNTSNREE